MKASLIVLDDKGELVEVGPQIPVDRQSVLAEVVRLRRKHGRSVAISSDQIVWARQRMERQPAIA